MPPTVIVLMGPEGAGKTTVGQALASALGWRFQDADDLHSAASRARLARGEALTDAERAPWLTALRGSIAQALENEVPTVLACSALKAAYRAALLPTTGRRHTGVCMVYLRVTRAELARRVAARVGHFAPLALLPSQLATLEEPRPEEAVLTLDGERPIAELVIEIRRKCGV